MKKKLPALLLCLCLMALFAACDQSASQGSESIPSEGLPETESLSPEGSPETAAPAESDAPSDTSDFRGEPTEDLSDILDGEQLALFEKTEELYLLMFGGDTEEIGSVRHDEATLPPPEEMTFEDNDFTYQAATGYYADWQIFTGAVHSVFSDRFWNERAIVTMEGVDYPIYIQHDGRMYLIPMAMGGGGHNDNFPDLYRLDGRTADSISFTIIGHYSEMRPLEGESYEERDQRVATTYDYTLEFSVRLVLTEEGWRFDEFHSAQSAPDISAAETKAGIVI